MDHLTSIRINELSAKSWVANEFLDNITCYDVPEHGLDNLILRLFKPDCEPFEEEVMTRLAKMCPFISNLQLSRMHELSEAGRLLMLSLFMQIIQRNPPIQVLNMEKFSGDNDRDGSNGECVLEALMSSNIESITELDLSNNESWFNQTHLQEERKGNVDLLLELTTKQAGL